MAIPENAKDQAVYHMILAELHRLQAILLNLGVLDDPSTSQGLREHFSREQTLALGKLTEWRSHRPEIYRQANEDFTSAYVRRQ